MATRRDPSSTGIQSRALAKGIQARLHEVSKNIRYLLVDKDALGLSSDHGMNGVGKGQWRYHTDAQKVEAFSKRIAEMIDAELLSTDSRGRPWFDRYIKDVYTKGVLRAFTDVNRVRKARKISPEWFDGRKAEFLNSILSSTGSNGPALALGTGVQTNVLTVNAPKKPDLLTARLSAAIKGLSAQASAQLGRVLSDGLIRGWGAKYLAQQMAKQISGLAKSRAKLIARTELVGAQAEGQLDSFEAQGIEKVGLYSEWHTMNDDKVCGLCEPLDKVQFTIKEARGMIPRHPLCRCSWVPGEMMAGHNRTRTLRRKTADSILAERKKYKGKTKAARVREAKKLSSWPGSKLAR